MYIPGSALIGFVTVSALSLMGTTNASSFSLRSSLISEQVVAPAPVGQGITSPDPQTQPPATPPAGTAQTPAAPPGAPAAPAVTVPVPGAPPLPIGRVFGSDAGMILSTVRPDKVMDFEEVLERIHEALSISTDPVRRQQAAGWKAFKEVEPGPNSTVLYVFIMDPAVKGADYTVSKLLSEAFPDEVQEIYKLYNGSFAGGQTLMNLTLVGDFSTSIELKPHPRTAPVAPAAPTTPPSMTPSLRRDRSRRVPHPRAGRARCPRSRKRRPSVRPARHTRAVHRSAD